MNFCQKLGIVSRSFSFAVVSQCFSAQAATLTQTYTVNLGSQPLNSSTNVVLPKFNSLLGTILKAYVTVNNSVSITPLTGDFMGTAATNASIAVNIPRLVRLWLREWVCGGTEGRQKGGKFY
jgi:hypothetical protein